MRLTAFQTECEQQLLDTLEGSKWKVVERFVEGINEKYIRILVRSPEVNLYIYEDEAGIQGEGIDIRLEQPDHKDSKKLIAAFIGSIRELENRITEPGS